MANNSISGWGFGGFGRGQFGNSPIELLPVEYYLRLLTSEYQNSPSYLAFVESLIRKLDDASQVLVAMPVEFDLDNARGVQLDILGVIIGQPRVVGFQPSNSLSPVLTDATYRLLLKARVAQNQWPGTIDALQDIWHALFPGGNIIIQDAQNMSANIVMSGAFSSITQDLIRNGYIVPRPAGVLYQYVFAMLPVFGFDSNTSYVAGFDLGHFA